MRPHLQNDDLNLQILRYMHCTVSLIKDTYALIMA